MTDATIALTEIRRRSRPGLLVFPHSTQIPLVACHIDKLEISVSGAISYENEDRMRDTLGLFSMENSNRPPDQRVLNAPRGRSRNRLSIKKNRWHCAGKLVLDPPGATSRSVTLKLSLNPTRLAEHVHRVFPGIAADEVFNLSPERLLRRDPEVTRQIGLETLDGRDNCLLSRRWIAQISRRWPDFVAFYADQACQLVADDFNTFANWHEHDHPPRLRLQAPSLTVPSIGYAECYVEFDTDNAQSVYAAFENAIRDGATAYRLITQPNARVTEGRHGSARWIETPLTSAINVKVYAKTATRLRVETEYDPRRIGTDRSMGQLLDPNDWADCRTFGSRLDLLRRDAIDRMARLIHLVSETSVPRPDDVSAAIGVFIVALKRTQLRWEAVQAFLGDLFANGSAGGAPGTPIRNVAEAMVRAGLFEPVNMSERNSHRRFRPIGSLRSAIDAIRAMRTMAD